MKFRIAVLAGLLAFERSSPKANAIDYVRDVKPILADRCYSCHGAIRQKANLRLDTAALIRRGGESGPAIEARHSDESLLIERVTADEKSSERMPPPSEGVALGEREIGVLRAWIDQGAVAPPEATPADPKRHWAYVAPARSTVPGAAGQGWSLNPIDAFLAAGHQSKGLRASPPATNEQLLRRIYFDLVGLPPTRDELIAFRSDRSPDAYEKVVDRLLASPRYGERWGRHWMDVWRYSDWYGLGEEVRFSHPHIWHWRDWIVAALNSDKGYDRMIMEMLAGDELMPDDPATVRATGFLVRNWDIFNRNTWLANTVEHTARAFLGVTIQCARCHDHKFDPISQSDYYRLRAFFEPVHIRIDRVPGQPDRLKGGLPRAFDDFLTTPTFLFTRGDESRPVQRPLTPATPAVLGGDVRISSVPLPITASHPDKRDFVIHETVEAGEAAVRVARAGVARAREVLAQKTQTLTKAVEDERKTQANYQSVVGKPDDAKRARDQATAAIAVATRAHLEANDANSELSVLESALSLAEARQSVLRSVLRAERLEDEGANKNSSASWVEAAQGASIAQRKLVLQELRHYILVAERTLDRAKRTVDSLIVAGDPAKDPKLQTVMLKASEEIVDARRRLVELEQQKQKAESAAKEKPATSYTPRPLVFHRAKTTFRDVPANNPYPATSSGRRLALARWLVDRRNPLTARVAVNHLWMRHFGDPLVGSMFDFGLRTRPPAQHALLDWLATEFIDSGWSMKHLHRLIVTSQAYCMKSVPGTAETVNSQVDPDNQFLWRMNVKRMEAEVIRDSLLDLAGRLDSRMCGPDLPLASAETINRRSIYYRYARGDRIPFLVTFDAPSIEECYRRDETIVPQQALALINSGIALARAAEIAAVIDKEVGTSDGPSIRSAFILSAFDRILGRMPTDGERAECAQALDRLQRAFAAEPPRRDTPHGRARMALVHVLLNHNDFVSIR